MGTTHNNRTNQPICKFAASACNRHPGALSSLPSFNIAAYAASSNVLILDTSIYKVVAVLPIHSSSITHVHLLATPTTPIVVTSTSSGLVSIWQPKNPDDLSLWLPLCSWVAHQGPAITLDAIINTQPDTNSTLIASAGTDGRIEIRTVLLSSGEILTQLSTSVRKAPGGREVLPECIALFPQPHGALIALGGTDRRIQLYGYNHTDDNQLSFLSFLDGHRDWIRGLAFSKPIYQSTDQTVAVHYLASASTDGNARVWRITSADDTEEDSYSTSRVLVQYGEINLAFSVSALLSEHTAAVHTVAFEYPNTQSTTNSIHIVTASMDCSVAIWRPSELGAECVARFGLMGGQSAHALGFFGAVFTKHDITEVLGHNFGGALHRWKLKGDLQSGEQSFSYEYESQYAPGGHFDKVNNLEWSANGKYLLTTSSDKTARIFAEAGEGENKKFVEWARPQVHGHSIFTSTFCDSNGLKYVSGAEEKMLRVFDAPSNFEAYENGRIDSTKASFAVVPELGLSNKGVMNDQLQDINRAGNITEEGENASTSDMIVSSFGATRASSVIPLEEELKQNTLWPESAKLYGHGNEVSCVEVHIEKGIIASACRAQQEKDACIILWDLETGVERTRLVVHELTINELRFSQNGELLLSISKDRSYSVFRRDTTDDIFNFKLVSRRKTAHARVIYTCCWLPQGTAFVTGARDKCIKIHKMMPPSENEVEEVFKMKFGSGVTAMDAISGKSGQSILAAGFEDGSVRVFSIIIKEQGTPELETLHETENHTKCSSRVTKVRWRPNNSLETSSANNELAISSEDCSIRILSYPSLTT